MCNDKQTICIVRGTTNEFSVSIIDESSGDKYELQSGEVVRFGVKKSPNDATYIVSKTITTADSEGDFPFTLTPNDTINLPFGSYYYDVGLQSGDDYYNIIPASSFELVYNITKREA